MYATSRPYFFIQPLGAVAWAGPDRPRRQPVDSRLSSRLRAAAAPAAAPAACGRAAGGGRPVEQASAGEAAAAADN